MVTVNDYLAKRDSQEMGQIFNFLGLTSDLLIITRMIMKERKTIIVISHTQQTVN